MMYKLRTLSFSVFCYSYLLTSIECHMLGIKKQIILLSKTLTWYSPLYMLTLHFLFFQFSCKQIIRMVHLIEKLTVIVLQFYYKSVVGFESRIIKISKALR